MEFDVYGGGWEKHLPESVPSSAHGQLYLMLGSEHNWSPFYCFAAALRFRGFLQFSPSISRTLNPHIHSRVQKSVEFLGSHFSISLISSRARRSSELCYNGAPGNRHPLFSYILAGFIFSPDGNLFHKGCWILFIMDHQFRIVLHIWLKLE